MKTITRCIIFVGIAVALTSLTGCGGNWMVGNWELDEERTLLEIEQTNAEGAGEGGSGLLKDIVGGLQKGVFRILLAQFEGTELEITKTEIRRHKDGLGEATTYEIIEKPNPDSYLVRNQDGSIVTWERVENGIRRKMSGDGEIWAYFAPVRR